MSKLLNIDNIKKELKKFPDRKPFPFAVIDNFFKINIAKELEIDFPEYLNKHAWYNYDNYSPPIIAFWEASRLRIWT